MTRAYHLEESRKSDETGDAYLNLFLATVRLAQRDVDNPATLDFGDDKEKIRQDAIEFLAWAVELASTWRDDEEEREVIREATGERWMDSFACIERKTKPQNLDRYWTVSR